MLIDSAINGKNYRRSTKLPMLNTWTAITVCQERVDEKFMFSIKVGDKLVLNVENTDPKEFSDDKVYASNPWNTVQPGWI